MPLKLISFNKQFCFEETAFSKRKLFQWNFFSVLITNYLKTLEFSDPGHMTWIIVKPAGD